MHQPIPDWHTRLRAATDPLPGSTPYVSQRPLTVAGPYDRTPLLVFLCKRHAHISRERWQAAVGSGAIQVDGQVERDPARELRAGNRLLHTVGLVTEPPVPTKLQLVYHDDTLLVVNKPAPLPVHPCGRFSKHTVGAFLATMLPEMTLKPAHRLDADTTGLLLMAKSRSAAAHLTRQFEQRTVRKHYLARVHGEPSHAEGTIDAAIGTATQPKGARAISGRDGQPARTDYRLLATFDDGTALLEAIPHTGRTNQIRLHLASVGHPIVGDTAYGHAAPAGAQEAPEQQDKAALGSVDTQPSEPVATGSARFSSRHAREGGHPREPGEQKPWIPAFAGMTWVQFGSHEGSERPQALSQGAIGLHAWKLEVAHPTTEHTLTLEAAPPAWAATA